MGRVLQAATRQLGLRSIILFAAIGADIDAAFETVTQQHIDAIVVANDPFFGAKRDQIVALAEHYTVPMMSWQREFATAGGLISYGPVWVDGYRQAGISVGRILKGEKRGDLPVVQPTKFELVINLKTAKALGLAVPQTLIVAADEVIE